MYRKVFILLLVLSLLAVPAAMAAEFPYVCDDAGLLTEDQIATLESMGQSAADNYGIGMYIITVDDYNDYGSGDVFEVSYQLYHEHSLGRGDERNGILLLLSMQERDYALFVYGDQAEYAFSDYALQMLEDQFLDDFKWDDWYDGLYDYMETGLEFLGKAAQGEPVRENMMKYTPIVIGIALLVAYLVCGFFKSQMKSVFKKAEADTYTDEGGLVLTDSQDHYTHTTTVRTKINTSSSSSRSGGGGSGRSGKF